MDQMLATLRKIFTTAGEDFTTTDEVARALVQVVRGIQNVREAAKKELDKVDGDLQGKFKACIADMNSMETMLKGLITGAKGDAKVELKAMVATLRGEMRDIEDSIPNPTDLKEVFSELQRIEDLIPSTLMLPSAEQIRDSLETLEDEERLDASAIKNLEKFVKDLAPRGPIFGGGRSLTVKDRGTIIAKNVRTINFLGTEANAAGDEVTIEPIVVSDTAPTAPFENQLWVDTS